MIEAAAPKVRRTVAMRTATAAMPISASGTRTVAGESPNRRTERPITIVASGGLSTVMNPDGSTAPKNHADQDCEAAHAAAE